MTRHTAFLIGIAVLLISSCASQPTHQLQNQLRAGDLVAAEQTLGGLYTGEKNTVLHNFYDASIQQLKGDYDVSNRILEETKPLADELALISISETVGASTVGESLQSYGGSQFERLMIYCHKFLNYMALGDYNAARIETEQAELKLREWQRDLQDFPFLPFLNALAYEAQGQADNALVSYRRALEAYDGYAPGIVEQSYVNLLAKDRRVEELQEQEQILDRQAQEPQDISLIIVVADGIVSSRYSSSINYAAPDLAGSFLITIPFYPDYYQPVSSPLIAANRTDINSEIIINIEQEMRKALNKQMPGFIARGVARAVTRSQIQQQTDDTGVAALFYIASLATEIATADTRSWDILPQVLFMARIELPHTTPIRVRPSGNTVSSPSPQLEPGLNFLFIQAR